MKKIFCAAWRFAAVILFGLIIAKPCCSADATGIYQMSATAVKFGILPRGNIVTYIGDLAEISSAPINIEIIHRFGQPPSLILPKFSLPEGAYLPAEVLRKLEKSSTEIKCIFGAGETNVTINLSSKVQNPFTNRLRAPVKATGLPSDWVSALSYQDRTSGMQYVPYIDQGQGDPCDVTQVSTTVKSGDSLREVLNIVCSGAGIRWIADVMDYSIGPFYNENGQRIYIGTANRAGGRTRVSFQPYDCGYSLPRPPRPAKDR